MACFNPWWPVLILLVAYSKNWTRFSFSAGTKIGPDPWQGDRDAYQRARLSEVRAGRQANAAARRQRPTHLSMPPLRPARPDEVT